ncbi:hypothetical protein ACLK1T_02520 [Escherichia coli]
MSFINFARVMLAALERRHARHQRQKCPATRKALSAGNFNNSY